MVKLTARDTARSRAEEALIKAIDKRLICQLHTGPLETVHPDVGGAIIISFRSAKDTEGMSIAISNLTKTQKQCLYPGCEYYDSEAEEYCCNGCSFDHTSSIEAGLLDG